MNFDQIESFYLIAVLGTFAQAAQRLNTTQPAISARVAALENRLGVKLFDRAGQRATLTPAGRRFLRSAEKLLEIQSEILAETGNSQLSGVLRIGVSDTMAMTWVPGFLAGLRQSYPDLIIELSIGPSFGIRDGLVKRELEVGFMVGPVSDPDIVNHVLCDCPIVMAAPPSMGLGGRRINRQELQLLNLVTFERVTQPYQTLLSSLRAADLSPSLHAVNSLQAVVLLACEGFGVGVLPLGTIKRELANNALELLDVDLELSDVRFAACYPEGPDTWPARIITEQAIAYLCSLDPTPAMKLLCSASKQADL